MSISEKGIVVICSNISHLNIIITIMPALMTIFAKLSNFYLEIRVIVINSYIMYIVVSFLY